MKISWATIIQMVMGGLALAAILGFISLRDDVARQGDWINDMMQPGAILPGAVPRAELALQLELLEQRISASETALRIDLEQTKIRLTNVENGQ